MQGRDLDRLLSRYLAVAHGDGGGATVFVAGGTGSGRTPLLRAFADALSGGVEPRPNLLAGGFDDGRYVPWPSAPAEEARALALLEDVVTVTAPLVPLTGLVAQMLSTSKAAQRLVRRTARQGNRREPQDLLPLMLDALCEDGPAVCIVDDADRSASLGWWTDVTLDLAAHVAAELPLLLVMAVEGPLELGDHEDDELDSLAAARLLTRRGLAEWQPLAPLDEARLAEGIGSAAPEVVEGLLGATGGRAEWASELWRDWLDGDVVERGPDGRWSFSSDGSAAAARRPVQRRVADRLERLLPGASLRKLDGAREVLACAALEGERFTALAVAEALELDPDEVIDLLDDSLSVESSATYGFVTEVGAVRIADEAGERHLWLYRFRSRLDWLTLHHRALTDDGLPRVSTRLAEAMAGLYGSEQHRVALTLARLLDAAGEPELASRYRRLHDLGADRATIQWRARRVLSEPEPEDHTQRRRASQLLIAAAEMLFKRGPFDEGLAYAVAAHRLAPLRTDQAYALSMSAGFRHQLGDGVLAATEANEALSLFAELGSRDGQAMALQQLGVIQAGRGDYALARETALRALRLAKKAGNMTGEAAIRKALAVIDIERGDYAQARDELERLLQLRRDVEDLDGEADVCRQLAVVDIEQGRYSEARDRLHHAIRLKRQLGDRQGEAEARRELAVIDFRQGDIGRARREFEAVFAIFRDLADRRGEADMRRELATTEIELGNLDVARVQLKEVLAIMEAFDDWSGVAGAIDQLAVIDHREGEPERARAGFARVLEIRRQRGPQR